jgi:hypothetical protein
MPLYKGLNEITGGGLYKGTTEIENGFKNSQFFYENLSTISWVAPTGQGLTYSVPTPQTQTKDGGVTMDTVTFTITNPAANIQGTVAIAGMPPGLTFTQVNSGVGLGNIITITINGTMPEDSYFNTLLTISGVTGSTNYDAHFLMCGGGGTSVGAGGGGVRTSYGSVSGGGAAAESQLAMVAGQDYVITINNPVIIQSMNSCSYLPNTCPGGSSYVIRTARTGGSVSIIGGAINKTVLGGAAGRPNDPDITSSFGGVSYYLGPNSNGRTGGCGGGGRAMSNNTAYSTTYGGSGTAGQGFGGGQAGPVRSNTYGIGGGGGAGSAGGNTGTFQSNPVTGAAGLPLSNSITASAYNYASGSGVGQLSATNYGAANGAQTNGGDPSRMGVFVLRMPTANFGSITGTQNINYTRTTTGNETILTIFGGNGSANGGVGVQLTYTA